MGFQNIIKVEVQGGMLFFIVSKEVRYMLSVFCMTAWISQGILHRSYSRPHDESEIENLRWIPYHQGSRNLNYPGIGTASRLPPPQAKGARGGESFFFP